MKILSILITVLIIAIIVWGYSEVSLRSSEEALKESGMQIDSEQEYIPAMVNVKQQAEQNIRDAAQKQDSRIQEELETLK